MRESVLKAELTDFGDGVGRISPQVGYPALEALALSDRSQLGIFMRSLCGGDDTLSVDAPGNPVYEGVQPRKNAMASYVASQILLGRQISEGTRAVGAFQSFMAAGNSMMDTSPFGECMRSMGAPPP